MVMASGWRSEGSGGLNPCRGRTPMNTTLTPPATFDPGLPQCAQKMISSQDLKVSEMISFARDSKKRVKDHVVPGRFEDAKAVKSTDLPLAKLRHTVCQLSGISTCCQVYLPAFYLSRTCLYMAHRNTRANGANFVVNMKAP